MKKKRTVQTTASASKKAVPPEIVIVAPVPTPDDPSQTRFDLSVEPLDADVGVAAPGKSAMTHAEDAPAPVDEVATAESANATASAGRTDGEPKHNTATNPAAPSTPEKAIPTTPIVPVKPAADINQTSVELLLEQLGGQKESAAAGETSDPKAEAPTSNDQTMPAVPAAAPDSEPESVADEWARLTAGLKPPSKEETVEQKLKSRLPLFRRSRRKGLSWAQLVGVAAKLNITITESYLRKVVGGSRRRQRKSKTTGSSG